MKPLYLTIPALKSRGRTFLELLDAVDSQDAEIAALAKTALKALDKRGFSTVPKAKGGKTQHATGKALFTAFDHATGARKAAKGKVGDATQTADKATRALKDWLRDTHRMVAAVKRSDAPEALAGLPMLGELEVAEGLRTSAQDLIAFLGRPEVLEALADYHVTATDRVAGEHALAAWDKSLTLLGGLRGVRAQRDQSDIQARDEFATWLTKWHEFAQVELKGQPRVLKALGVDVQGPRGPRTKKGKGAGDEGKLAPTEAKAAQEAAPAEADA